MGVVEAAEFDAAARQAFHAALKLDRGTPSAPVPLETRPSETPEPVPGPVNGTGLSAWATPSIPPPERLATLAGQSPEDAIAAPHWRQPGETAPDSLMQTSSNVTLVADDFFDGLIRRVEGDR